MLPNFTGVLAVQTNYWGGLRYEYCAYINGRRIPDTYLFSREMAESLLAEELDGLAAEDGHDDA